MAKRMGKKGTMCGPNTTGVVDAICKLVTICGGEWIFHL
jgi:hypothetical protein